MKSKNLSLRYLLSDYEMGRPLDVASLFGREAPLDLEIGFGDGEFLQRMATENSDRNYLGLERIWERLCKTLRKVNASGLSNVRVMLLDAGVVLERYIKPKTISNAYCLFPCPWPKKAHVKHRLFSKPFLELLNSRMQDNGYLKIVTDHAPYMNWILGEAEQGCGFNVETTMIEPCYDTKFERKWTGAGQEKFYKIEFFKNEHINVELKKDIELKPLFIDEFYPDRFMPQDVSGNPAVIFKDFLYDARREQAMIRCIVSENELTQHMWVAVRRNERGWCVVPAEGHRFIPTEAVAKALKVIRQECSSTVQV